MHPYAGIGFWNKTGGRRTVGAPSAADRPEALSYFRGTGQADTCKPFDSAQDKRIMATKPRTKTDISLYDISVLFAVLEEPVDPGGEEFPLFGAPLQFRPARCGNSVGVANAALTNRFRPAFEPALFLHLPEKRIDAPKRGMHHLMGDIGEFLPDEIAVHGTPAVQQRQNEHIGVPLHHFAVNTSFHAADISHNDISTSTHFSKAGQY